MPGVSREQTERAKTIDLLTYLQRREPGAIKKTGADEYCLREHDSLKISNGKWHWFSRGIGGKTALDFLIRVRGMGFVEAVRTLTFETPPAARSAIRDETKPPGEKPPPKPPKRNGLGTRAISYLQNVRGIDDEILTQCLSQKKLYEGVYEGRAVCVFVGEDKDGAVRYVGMRGINDDFKGEAANSDKRHGFVITSKLVPCRRLIVTESAIDAMSVASVIKKTKGRAWTLYEYLSLGCVSPLALIEYLKTHESVERIVLCLDNDKAGREASEKIRKALANEQELRERALVVTDRFPGMKDWNEELLATYGGGARPPEQNDRAER